MGNQNSNHDQPGYTSIDSTKSNSSDMAQKLISAIQIKDSISDMVQLESMISVMNLEKSVDDCCYKSTYLIEAVRYRRINIVKLL